MMAVVDRGLSKTQQFMLGQATFQVEFPVLLEMTHATGGAVDEVHAFGTPTASDFTVLAESLLLSAFRSVAQLKGVRGPESQIALQLWQSGILDRQRWTRTRLEGLCFAERIISRRPGKPKSHHSLYYLTKALIGTGSKGAQVAKTADTRSVRELADRFREAARALECDDACLNARL